jgi:putative nucleotidyltransferase with HDIG domain
MNIAAMTSYGVSATSPELLSLIYDGDPLRGLDALPDAAIRRHWLGATVKGLADTVVVAVNLQYRDNVLKLREVWSELGQPARLVFITDKADHFSATQANALGAQHVLPAPLNVRALAAVLRPQSAQTIRAVAMGAEALEALFGGLLSGGRLPASELARASTEVLESLHRDGLDGWLDAVRLHHRSTYQHCLVVTGVIANFARATGMSRTDMMLLTIAGFLHDIGKIRVPLAILDKPAALTHDEFNQIKRHPLIGFEYLKGEPKVTGDVLSAVRHHHEFLDGSGYPYGLVGEAIDDLTRILTICDIYGALVESRPYKAASPPAEAVAILRNMADQGKVEAPLVGALARSVGVGA